MKNLSSKFLLILLFSLSFTTVLIAQEKFDVVTFTTPKGWQKSTEANAIQFTKQEGDGVGIMMLFKSLPTDQNSKMTFDASWETIVKGLFDKVDTPNMQPILNENGWTIESGAAIGEKSGSKAVVMLISATGGGKVVNLLIINNSQSIQADIDVFVASLVLQKVSSTVANNNPRLATTNRSTNSQLAGKIWEWWDVERFSSVDTRAGYNTGGFTVSQYKFNADGTFRWTQVFASAQQENNLLQYETGTYSVTGNQLTITPTSGSDEEWTVIGGGPRNFEGMSVDHIQEIKQTWGKRIKTQKRNLERVTYPFSFTIQENKNTLVLKHQQETKREGKSVLKESYFYEKSSANTVKLPSGY